MKNTGRIIGWICFGIAAVVYLIVTCYFGIGFADATADNKEGETLGLGVVLIIFLVFGSIAYLVDAVVSIIGTIAANVKRGERKFFFAPIITLALSVLTWVIFVIIGLCL